MVHVTALLSFKTRVGFNVLPVLGGYGGRNDDLDAHLAFPLLYSTFPPSLPRPLPVTFHQANPPFPLPPRSCEYSLHNRYLHSKPLSNFDVRSSSFFVHPRFRSIILNST